MLLLSTKKLASDYLKQKDICVIHLWKFFKIELRDSNFVFSIIRNWTFKYFFPNSFRFVLFPLDQNHEWVPNAYRNYIKFFLVWEIIDPLFWFIWDCLSSIFLCADLTSQRQQNKNFEIEKQSSQIIANKERYKRPQHFVQTWFWLKICLLIIKIKIIIV